MATKGTWSGNGLDAYSVRGPSFRSVGSWNSKSSTAIPGRGMLTVSPSISLLETPLSQSYSARETLSRTRSSCRQMSGILVQHHFSLVSNPQYKSQSFLLPKRRAQYGTGGRGAAVTKKPDKKSVAASKEINKKIVALGQDGKWMEILNLYTEKKQQFNPINYATVMSQMGRIRQGQKHDPLFLEFLSDLRAKFHANGITWLGEARDLATMVHALAKMGLDSNKQDSSSVTTIMGVLDDAKTTAWLFEDGTPQAVGHCIWACGKLGIKSPNLFRMLDQRAAWLFEHGSTQTIANCVWACGKLGIRSPNLFRLLDQRADWLIGGGHAQQMTNCVWACGKVGIKCPNLFRLLDESAEILFDTGTAQGVASFAWACGTLKIQSPNLFRLLDQRANWLVERGASRDLADVLWACGKLKLKSPKLRKLCNRRRAAG